MTRQQLEALCQPQTPYEVLDNLRELYDALANSPGWVSEAELEALSSAIEVQKAVISEVG